MYKFARGIQLIQSLNSDYYDNNDNNMYLAANI